MSETNSGSWPGSHWPAVSVTQEGIMAGSKCQCQALVKSKGGKGHFEFCWMLESIGLCIVMSNVNQFLWGFWIHRTNQSWLQKMPLPYGQTTLMDIYCTSARPPFGPQDYCASSVISRCCVSKFRASNHPNTISWNNRNYSFPPFNPWHGESPLENIWAKGR